MSKRSQLSKALILLPLVFYACSGVVPSQRISGGSGSSSSDTTPPAVPLISLSTPSASPGNDASPTFSISLTGGGSFLSSDTLSLHEGADCSGPAVSALLSGQSGASALLTRSTNMAETTTNFQVKVMDLAGNSSCSTVAATYEYDGTAPAVPLIGYSAPASSPGIDSTPTFAITLTGGGNFSATDSITLHEGANCNAATVATAVTGQSGASATITRTAAMSAGTTNFRALVTDDAGNSTCSAALSYQYYSSAPSSLSYTSPVVFVRNLAISSMSPTTSGVVTGFSAPSLPAGLSIHATTGVISGTPTANLAAANYTVTASNGIGSITFDINIRTGDGFLVNSLTDASDAAAGNGTCATAGAVCTLRAAVEESNAVGGFANPLIVLPAGTIALSGTSQIAVTSDLEIIGVTRDSSIIDGGATGAANSSQRIFYVNRTGAVPITLALQRVTLTNAKPPNNLSGGCLLTTSLGNVTMNDVAITNCHVTGSADGGGAYLVFNSTYNIQNCYVANNSSGANGGGFQINTDTVSTLSDCKIENNTATGAGGGLSMGGSENNLIQRSLFKGNTAGNNGGGVDCAAGAGALSFINNTFYDNLAGSDGTGGGGGLYCNGGGVAHTVTNNTFVDNQAQDAGGLGGGGPFLASNNLLYNNTTLTSVVDNCGFSITSGGGNIWNSAQADCGFTEATDQETTSASLGSLQDNGGYWETFSLNLASPGIDEGVNGVCPAVDARGVSRPQNGTCDVGAFERE
jgi:large repetitive protein